MIEDYGLIGNTISAALVHRNGSIDWLCLPQFDSAACFAALVGTEENGYWQICPAEDDYKVRRTYRPNTTILETIFETSTGTVVLTDFMPLHDKNLRVDLMRRLRCTKGHVDMVLRLVIRCDYGQIVPWVKKAEGGLTAIAGPDALRIFSDVALEGEGMTTTARFTLQEGETKNFGMTWYFSHHPLPPPRDYAACENEAEKYWQDWAAKAEPCLQDYPRVMRSLVTLKALTFTPTGAIIAAPTSSLPEEIGGERNWDYRYCWIRDSTLLLYAFLISGYSEEAQAWRDWLLRAAAGDPAKLQIMYGLRGERRLEEFEVPWLKGYENSRPVRIGNAAHNQLQLDVYGELMDTLHVARKFDIKPNEDSWQLEKAFVGFLAKAWEQPDNGIWEMRGAPQHFTHSKVMAWVALDRVIKGVTDYGLDGPVEEWKALAAKIHADVCEKGYNAQKGCFVQAYGGTQLDASLLLLAQLGFVKPDDPRYLGTVAAIERELIHNGLVLRYKPEKTDDGLSGGEGAFLACSFWLVDAYALTGRFDDAMALFKRLLTYSNDLGLFSEEYDPVKGRQLGNFPQAFTHISLINAAQNLLTHRPPAKDRSNGHRSPPRNPA